MRLGRLQPGVDVGLPHLVELGEGEGGDDGDKEQADRGRDAAEGAGDVEQRGGLEGEGGLVAGRDAADDGWGGGGGVGAGRGRSTVCIT